MTLKLCAANPGDAARIAEIHMAAFGDNEMLLAQFPTAACRKSLVRTIELKALADIEDDRTTVLVVRKDVVQNSTSPPGQHHLREEVMAFAKWSHPVFAGEDYVEPPWQWPSGTDYGVLDAWTEETSRAHAKVLGEQPCYQVTFIGTDPARSGQGAGSMLMRWGIAKAMNDKLPIFIESTLEAVPFYTRLGFVAAEHIKLEIPNGDVKKKLYQEQALVLWPS